MKNQNKISKPPTAVKTVNTVVFSAFSNAFFHDIAKTTIIATNPNKIKILTTLLAIVASELEEGEDDGNDTRSL